MVKVYNIPQKYRFPKGAVVEEILELRYPIPRFNISSVKSFYIFPRCKDGWFVVDVVNNGTEIIATLGKTTGV